MIIPANVSAAKQPKRFICSVLVQERTISKGRIGIERCTEALKNCRVAKRAAKSD
jgi:hypothetical protein